VERLPDQGSSSKDDEMPAATIDEPLRLEHTTDQRFQLQGCAGASVSPSMIFFCAISLKPLCWPVIEADAGPAAHRSPQGGVVLNARRNLSFVGLQLGRSALPDGGASTAAFLAHQAQAGR